MEEIEKLIIIGSGPAGLSAAIYAARGELKPLIIAGNTPGGQPTLATDIDDYPGFPDGINAPDLAHLFWKQAERFNTRFINEEVESVDFTKSPFLINTKTKKLKALSVIIATGSSPLWLGLPQEKQLIGRGVSACAVCDGPFFKGKKVVIVGGGDTALKESIYLSKIASEVTVIHRRDELRAQELLQQQAKAKDNIKFILNAGVEEILGEQKVTGLKIKDNQTGKTSEIEADGIFIAIGHKPATGFLKDQVDLDKHGFVVKTNETETSVKGVFVAGDVADPRYRQIVTAVGSGAKAALDVEQYLDTLD
ncbi:MAG: thioredoxin-disulfide reductase [Candidatus Daviesbacteria bacterium]|nr:thioredoxin-disulfide reductase [Candidatus Daviesbacteria bacterium]